MCTLKSPNRCIDGQCRKFPFLFDSETENAHCSSGIECPAYRPYLCADGSCKEKSSFCKSLDECPPEKNIRCNDRTCVARFEDCKFNKSTISCPEKNPILCSDSGNCVRNYFDCFPEKCPDVLPIKCSSGICVASPRECVYKLTVDNEANRNKNFTDISGCAENEEICFDGTCRDNIAKCPVYNGCNNPEYPYKCLSGKCAKNSYECDLDVNGNPIKFRELKNIKCNKENNEKLCDDGLCRKICPISNSCNNNLPYLCTNGICVKDIWECAGESKCPIGNPFRCVDGTCRKNPSDCYKSKKLETSTDLNIFVYPQHNLNTDIVIDEYNNIISSIKIPSNSFMRKLSQNSTDEGNNNENLISEKQIISIKTMPKSFPYFQNTVKSYKEEVRDFILKLFPYGDQEDTGLLEFKYAIVSPVLSIDYKFKDLILNQNIELRMSYDLSPAGNIGDITKRVCFAYLPKEDKNVNNTINAAPKWECKVNPFDKSNRLIDNFISGKVEKEGYYAIAVDIDFNQVRILLLFCLFCFIFAFNFYLKDKKKIYLKNNKIFLNI